MPDNTQPPVFTIPSPAPNSNFVPDSGMPKLDELDNWQNRQQMKDLGPSGAEYAQSIASGESITDLIKDVQDLQDRGQAILDNNNFTGVPNSPSPGGFNPDAAFQDLSRKLNPETPSLQAAAAPLAIGTERDYNRYKESKHFQTFGYTPNLGSGQEYKYGTAMGWGETIGNALAGGSHLAWDTFVEGWKGWGRMTSALFTWDSSKLMGTPEEREEIARKQEELMNKYAIYDTAESKDSLWNRQMFGNMLQQSGFAVGAISQFIVEEWLTAGMATFIEPALKGVMIGRVARGAEELAAIRQAAGLPQRTTILGRAIEKTKELFRPKLIETAGDLINTNRQVANVITKSERVTNAITKGLKTLTPGYGTVEEMIKMNKAGAGFAQLAYTGLGGVKRGLSEFNMARSESIFEAASTYVQLKDRLVGEFVQTNGREPSEEELEKIKQSAENASHDNFWTNMGVLSVMNRIQFDNMFKQFSKSRTLLGPEMAQLEGKAFQVTGKVGGKTEARVYKKGLLGRLGAAPEIAKTFGKKRAAWEAAKGIPGLMKFEFAEGAQELIQNASSKGLEDYYADLYHGKKGFGTKMDSILSSVQNPFTDMEGMKTFLMGALTGRLIAPLHIGVTKISEGVQDKRNIKKATEAYKQLIEKQVQVYTEQNGKAPEGDALVKIQEFAKQSTEYKTVKQHVDEAVQSLNALYQDKTWVKNEALANIKINNKAAETMDEAAANHDRYTFNNVKDSALAKAVASSIKLNLYESLRDVIKEHGVEMTDEEFQQAFGMDPNKENKGNAKKLTENVVKQIEEYYDTFKKLKDKYADRIMPELYKNNKPEDYKNAQLQKAVLDDVIEMIATNSYKAKQAIVRAVGLQTEMGQNKAIGSSSIEILTKLGSEQELMIRKAQINNTLRQMQMSDVPLTAEQKQEYKELKEELENIENWDVSVNELLANISTEYSPTVETRAYKAYANLINLFNKKANNNTAISKEDVEDNFLKFIDYLKLNRDNKKFIDALNLLSDPKNMKLVTQAKFNSLMEYAQKAYEEQLREIEEATGVDIPRHSVVKNEDGTFSIMSHDGVVVESKLATEEEAKAKAAEYDEKLKKALEEEEAKTKEKEEKPETKVSTGINIISTPSDEIIAELNKLSTYQEKLKWLRDNNLLEPIKINGKEYDVVDYDDRVMVLMKIGKYNIPFYISTGTAGKKTVEAGKWYVVFGIGEEMGWINKGSEEQINKQYDFPIFQKFAKILNEGVGRIETRENNGKGKLKDGIGFLQHDEADPKEIREFNSQMNLPTKPAGRYDDSKAFYDHVNATLAAVNTELGELAKTTSQPTTAKLTLDDILDQIKNAKDKAELDKIVNNIVDLEEKGELGFESTEEIANTIEKAYDDRVEELEKIAVKAGTSKLLTDTDPEFVNPYYEALDNIEKVVNKPGVTWSQARTAFEALRPLLAKLEPAIREQYKKKHNAEREAVKNRLDAETAAKDIESVKKLISNSLASDTIPLNVSFQALYQQLNLKLSPELKEEAIAHFEKEYLKAIDRKLAKLLSKVNLSTSSESLVYLIAETTKFREKIEASITKLKEKSDQLKNETDKLRDTNGGLNVSTDPLFSNPVHRSIINREDGVASYGQKAAIENLVRSGILTQSDIDSEDENSKHGASSLVNLGVARISTLEINKALAQHFRGESSELKKLLTKYLSDNLLGVDGYTKEELKQDVEEFLDKDSFDSSDKILEAIGMPKTRELTKEEYAILGNYRLAIGNIIRDSAVIDTLDEFNKHQQDLLSSGRKALDGEILPKSLSKQFQTYLKKDVDGNTNFESFYQDLLTTFQKLKTAETSSEATKLVKEVFRNHMVVGSDGLDVLKALYASALQTDNLLKSESNGSSPLTEEEIVKVLDGEDLGISLNKNQITQIEKYAKEEKLPEYRRKLQAAVGYSVEGPVYTAEKNITVSKTGAPFSSLRQKFADDLRTAEDLSKYLMPDENGMVQTKLALAFVAYSAYATESEKAFAKKLLEIVSDDDMLKIDNNIQASGDFDPNTKQISINLEATGYKANRPSAPIETVILHELVHAMIEDALVDPNSEYSKSIKSLYNAVKNVEGAKTFYAFQDSLQPDEQLHEFVTEAFTNPAFQYLLAKTPYANTTQTLWDKFLEAISNILSKMGLDINNTALSEVLSLTDQVFNKEAISEGDKFPSEKVMEKIKNADTKEDIEAIRKELDANKDKYTPDMYNSLDASLRAKMKSINARNISDSLKNMEAIKIGKVTYYFTGDSSNFKVYKKGRTKINEVKDTAVRDKVKEILDKRNPPPPPTPTPTSGEVVQVFSDLRDKEFVEDPSTLDFSTVDPGETITAVEPNGLRSKGNDGNFVNGEYVEYDSFKKYYYKVRNIINKLSVAPSSELANFHVTLDMDSAGLRWDGSAEDAGWKGAKKGVIGYISDAEGNPIVFNKEGKAIGKADRNNPAASRFNTGENQIVYFNTYTENTDKRSLSRIEQKSLLKLFAARKRVTEGRPQIAKLQKVTPGQMILKSMVKAQGKSQMNTARDTQLRDQLNQDHVTLKLSGSQLNAFIKDSDGGIQRTTLFTPSTRSVKVVGPDGNTIGLFDHLIELMKVYHEMEANKDPNLADVQKDFVKFAQNMWLTGDAYSLKIPQNFMSIHIKVKGSDRTAPQVRLPIFEMKNGVLTVNENNLKAVKIHMEDMKVNIAKMWLEGKEPFKFPYITEVDGKKVINFEEKNYKEFLLNNVGLVTYITDVPEQKDIKRYNSSVHFLEPTDLNPKPPTLNVTENNVIQDDGATKKAVDNAVKNASTPANKNIKDPSKTKRFRAPSYEETYKETYEKICK